MDKEEAAESLAERIALLDETIFVVGIISNTGLGIGGFVRPNYRSRYSLDQTRWAEVAFKDAQILGSAKTTTHMFSDIESIVFIRSDAIGMLIWVPDRAHIVALTFDKTTNPVELSKKLRSYMKID